MLECSIEFIGKLIFRGTGGGSEEMNSTEKVLWILNRLGQPPYEIGLIELAKERGFGKSGIYKILSILVREGFVCQNPETKKYHLGPVLYSLGNVYFNQKGFLEIAKPVMQSINQITCETVSLGILEGDKAVLAYTIVSPYSVKVQNTVGKIFPINAGSTGKLLTAYLEPEKIKELLEKSVLEKRTPYTIVDKERLWKEYEKIRSQGYAISDEENTLGGYAVSAPIRDKSGKVFACLTIALPKSRLTPEKKVEYIELICRGAEEISRKLGFKN